MRDEERRSVESLPLFTELDDAQRKRLLRHALVQRVGPGVALFDQGEQPDFLHILMEGTVELQARDTAGHEAVIEVLQPVDSFILAAVLTDAPYLMSAHTRAHSRLLLLPAEQLRSDLRQEPALAFMLMGSLARQYRGMVRQIKTLKLRTAAERIGCYLLSLAREQGGSGTITLPYSKRLLARRMGMTPENLSRAFTWLTQRGVRTDGARIVIEDVDKLASFCQLDALIDGVEQDLRVPGQPGKDDSTHDQPDS